MVSTTEVIVIFVFTLINIFFNWWISLRAKRLHGLFRFFAFECIFIIIVMNSSVWFKEPFSPPQIISWFLLVISIYSASTGFYLFYKLGKPEDQMEETVNLVTIGIYKYIRHPLYLSLITGGFGAMMKDPGTIQIILGCINFIALYVTARVEEKEMIAKFGNEYEAYMKKSRMFIPFII